MFNDATILITGGTGSFGKHFCKIIIEKYKPKAIRIYSRDELKQHEMRREFGEEYIRYFIGDNMTDFISLNEILERANPTGPRGLQKYDCDTSI